jgi:hypothetical protein
MNDKKQTQADAEPEESFLTTTARAVGSTLGKLAAKTGLAHPEETAPPPGPLRKKKAAGAKKTITAKPVAKKAAAKKKASPRKPAVSTTKR